MHIFRLRSTFNVRTASEKQILIRQASSQSSIAFQYLHESMSIGCMLYLVVGQIEQFYRGIQKAVSEVYNALIWIIYEYRAFARRASLTLNSNQSRCNLYTYRCSCDVAD
jgi:hypothetical protein